MIYICDTCGKPVMHINLYGSSNICNDCLKRIKEDDKPDIIKTNTRLDELSKEMVNMVKKVMDIEKRMELTISEINKLKGDVRRLKTK